MTFPLLLSATSNTQMKQTKVQYITYIKHVTTVMYKTPKSNSICTNVCSKITPTGGQTATTADCIATEAQDTTFQQHAASMGHLDSMFYMDSNGLFMRYSTIHGASHIVVPKL